MKRISWLIAFVVLLGFAPSVLAMPQMHHDHMSRDEAHKAMEMLSKLAYHPKMIKKLSAEKTIWLLKGIYRLSKVSYAHHEKLSRLHTKLSLHLVDLQVKRLHDFYYDYYYSYDKKSHHGHDKHDRGDKHGMKMASDDHGHDKHEDESHDKHDGDEHGHDEHGDDDHDGHDGHDKHDDDAHHMGHDGHDKDRGHDKGHYGYGSYYDYYGHKKHGYGYGYKYDYHDYYYSYAYDASYYRYHKDASPYGYSSKYSYGYKDYYGYKHSSYHYPSVRVKYGKVHSPYKLGIHVKKMKFKMAKDCHYAQKEATYKHSRDYDVFVGPCQHHGDYVWTFNVWKV